MPTGDGRDMESTPLLVSANRQLIDHVRSLAEAGGLTLDHAETVESARAQWEQRELILIGDDLCQHLLGFPRRRDVSILCWQPLQSLGASPEVWKSALSLGAEQVVELPAADAWLAELLTQREIEATRHGRILAVTGSCGGAGASSCAVGLAAAVQKAGQQALLVDGDGAGGGLDLLLGAESQIGTRWADLSELSGRLSSASLLPNLPRPHGLALLSASRDSCVEPTPKAWESILEFGQRNFDLVIVDLPTHLALSSEHWWPHHAASTLWCVVPTRIRSIAAAAVCIEQWTQSWNRVELIARQTERGLATSDLARALGQAMIGSLPFDKSVIASSELGELSGGAFAKACSALAAEISHA